jgi:hypothetical protein
VPAQFFTQTIIALIWDFDKTVIPGYMQDPLFQRYDIDGPAFWDEVNAMPEFYRRKGLELVSPDTLYLNHILTYARHNRLPGLSNEVLRELGGRSSSTPGWWTSSRGSRPGSRRTRTSAGTASRSRTTS